MFATGVVGGAALTYVLRRPRLAVATAVVAPAVIVALLLQPAFQVRTWSTVKEFARIHVGHVTTPGYTYKLLDARLYDDVDLRSITIPEELRFVGHAFTAYVVQPTPRSIQSRATLAYLPEQVVWYGLVLLVPVGTSQTGGRLHIFFLGSSRFVLGWMRLSRCHRPARGMHRGTSS